jgi:hypothetical protein
MPTPAAIAAPATRFTYIPVRPFCARDRERGYHTELCRKTAALGARHIHLEWFGQLLLWVGHVYPGRGALDRVGVAALRGLDGALIRCAGRVAQRHAGEVTQSDRLHDWRISTGHHRADPGRRIADTDVDVAISRSATDLTSDVLILAVDDDLVTDSRR